LSFTGRIPMDAPDILIGDPGRLRQVIANIAGNAIKFTEKGEVRLMVEETSRDDSHIGLRFTITDTGPGIPEAKLAELFDAFTRGEGAPARTYGGKGLGLAISARLVELAGGKISVESEQGRGTALHFTLVFGLPRSSEATNSDLEEELLALADRVS